MALDEQRLWLAQQFQDLRPHLHAVAYRMLGSSAEADDAVQEAWLRLDSADSGAVTNLGGWLTTVIGRVCLDMLRSRKSRREVPVDDLVHEAITGRQVPAADEQALLADSVGLALLVVLETLRPAERLAFVLHDMFDVPFPQIASIIGSTPNNAAQLASRGRRRVSGHAPPPTSTRRQKEIVDAFVVAAREGEFNTLIGLLHPDVVLTIDAVAAHPHRARMVRGATAVATGSETFAVYAHDAETVLLDASVGLAVAPERRLRHLLAITIEDDLIIGIDIFGDPDRIRQTSITSL